MGPDFAKRFAPIKVQHQPAGIDFYSADWDRPPHAEVVLEHGANSLTIPHAIGLQGQQDLGAEQNEGLHEFAIYAALSEAKLIGHDEARLAMYGLLRKITGQGWKPLTDPSSPRLTGKQRLDYALGSSKYIGLDVAYVPTLDEWMRIESRTPWTFEANGLFLEVSFQREPTLTDPAKPGAYLVTLNVKSQVEYFRGFVDGADRPRWKAVVPALLKQAAETRAHKEAELKAKGIPVDESYSDPSPGPLS